VACPQRCVNAPIARAWAYKQLAGPMLSAFGDTLNARFESNILGLPGITVPAGFYLNGVPGTIQFVGSFYGEARSSGTRTTTSR
jgi:Asp-tRNA(Asn)/Glu-tRNA(Gln) amidotransferase A subunit family amidase